MANQINEEHINYYKTLEAIRRSGVCNMWGAAPYLADMENISEEKAEEVLLEWITNYNEIKKLMED